MFTVIQKIGFDNKNGIIKCSGIHLEDLNSYDGFYKLAALVVEFAEKNGILLERYCFLEYRFVLA